MIRTGKPSGVIKIAYRPELCAMVDHRGIAEQFIGPVLCRVHVAHRDRVLAAWWSRQREKTEATDVHLLPGANEPPIAFRLMG